SEGGYNVFVNDGRDDRMIRQTLIIYSDQTRPQVAKDIQLKLGGGRVIANEGRFGFDGNVLVIEANLPLIVKSLSNRGSFVAIRNGWGVENASRDVSASLFIEGWQITELGSMPSFHHNKTTVVYRSNDDHPEALLIADYLRCGFVMPALGRYHFDGDILVIIGEDLEVPTPRHGQSNFYP
ncbi:MAG: LytR C-terminal domain-containing protein, partial [Coriobacteriia bacterium]|nr:LytR C-terminal domain-containing protein [Coriobacteriia bacterium]